jgi:hypothetical protein
MSRPCSVCQLSPEALKRVGELVDIGTSERDVVLAVNNEFKVKLTHGSLNRHLNKCGFVVLEPIQPPTENLDYIRKKMKLPTLLGFQSFSILCRLFDEHLEAYFLKITRKRQEGLDISEGDLKEFEVIIKMHERLYPGESIGNQKRSEGDPRPVPSFFDFPSVLSS